MHLLCLRRCCDLRFASHACTEAVDQVPSFCGRGHVALQMLQSRLRAVIFLELSVRMGLRFVSQAFYNVLIQSDITSAFDPKKAILA